MRPTRRWWTLVGVGVVLLVLAVLGEEPLLLIGASVIGGFCLVAAVHAVSAFTTTASRIAAHVNATPQRVPVSGDTSVSLSVSVDGPLTHSVRATCEFPGSVECETVTLELEPGETEARKLVSPSFPVAGRFEFPRLSYAFESPGNFFVEHIPVDESTTVTAEAHSTGDVHIGAGGSPLQRLFGGHQSEFKGVRGDELSSIRQYEPGDSVRLIDWKATARLDEPHIREYESEIEQTTRLVIDAREHLKRGAPGRTKLDYIREVALSILWGAERARDPLGLTLLDDTGVRVATESASTNHHYQRIRETLLELGGEQDEARTRAATPAEIGPAEALTTYRALAARQDDTTPFVATLRMFFERTESYVAKLSEDPLFDATRRHEDESSTGAWTAILTDDSDRGRLVQTMKLATRGDRRATAFVTPSFLFEEHDVADFEGAYQQLVAFEEFRQELQRLPRATAYEVAPDERFRAVLTHGRDRATRRRPSSSPQSSQP